MTGFTVLKSLPVERDLKPLLWYSCQKIETCFFSIINTEPFVYVPPKEINLIALKKWIQTLPF